MRSPTPAQARAANPQHHVWVSANAGTGKTGVLSDRVLRLMLDGANPESILSITFTKAAAVEMIERIEAALAGWAVEPDDSKLSAQIEAMEGKPPSPERLARARQLYARVLELANGMQVMTIHSFCHGLLRRFPIEAGLPPHFEAIDERSAQEIVREVRAQIFSRSEHDLLSGAISILATRYAESSLLDLIDQIIVNRTHFEAGFARYGGGDGLIEAVAKSLDIKSHADPHQIIREFCEPGRMDVDGLVAVAEKMLEVGGKKNLAAGQAIPIWLERTHEDRIRLLEEYRSCFLTKDGRALSVIPTKRFREDYPSLVRVYAQEQARHLLLNDDLRAANTMQVTKAIIAFASALLGGYRQAKWQRAALDFDDLIDHAGTLLNAGDQRDWVLYKMDCRIDHLLVDEAQDTSPRQWAVIKPLIAELLSGEGRANAGSGVRRTGFVVGDAKQSIYSFQGADLGGYRAVHDWMASQGSLIDERLERSFRTASAILEVVDAVFAQDECRAATSFTGEQISHQSHFATRQGEVILWPLMPYVTQAEVTEPWSLPHLRRYELNASEKLATEIAVQVAQWLRSKDVLPSTGRRASPGDILILLAKRGQLQELIINALKRRGIPVAGADRLTLNDHLAVRDLTALGKALLLPEDDLNLACLLKSPLLDLNETALFELAHNRGNQRLIDRLRQMSREGREPYRTVEAQLSAWRAKADFMPPFELFSSILDPAMREAMATRMGGDCIEPIDAFLSQTLLYEQGHPASLQGFMHWFQHEGTTLKRSIDSASGEVRVMTVHASKGLEAPIVIIADSGPKSSPNRSAMLFDKANHQVFWRSNKDSRPPALEELVQQEAETSKQENLRLLYVAMTRAKDRLLVTGTHNKSGKVEGSWHNLIAQAMAGKDGIKSEEGAVDWNQSERRLNFCKGVAPERKTDVEKDDTSPLMLPAWALLPAPTDPGKSHVIRPSEAGDFDDADRSGNARNQARLYGDLFHRLLQILPPRTETDVKWDIERLVALVVAEATEPVHENIKARLIFECRKVVILPPMQPFLEERVKTEQAMVANLEGQSFSAQFDRLIVDSDAVRFMDIKTTRRVPSGLDEVPDKVLAQMAIYHCILSRHYPYHEIQGSLLYSTIPTIIPLPSNMLQEKSKVLLHNPYVTAS